MPILFILYLFGNHKNYFYSNYVSGPCAHYVSSYGMFNANLFVVALFNGIKMDYLSTANFHLKLFYFLGFSPYQPKGIHRRLSSTTKSFKFLQALISLSSAIEALYIYKHKGTIPQNSRTDVVVICIYLLCDLFRSTFILMQCLLYEYLIHEIIGIFVNLEFYFFKEFQHRIYYQKFNRTYNSKFLIIISICFVYISSFFGRLVFDSKTVGMPGSLYKVIQLMTAISYCYALLFIEMLNFHLKQLNLVVRKDLVRLSISNQNPGPQRQIVRRLKGYKIVHFHLWMANQRINKYFGYSIVAVLMHGFTDTVYSVFSGYERVNLSHFIWSIWSMIKLFQNSALIFLIEKFI